MAAKSTGLAFTAERAALLAAIDASTKATDSRNIIPIYGHVLLQSGAGRVLVRGTDGAIETTASLQAEVAIAGSITAPAQQLADIVKSLPAAAQITLAVTDGGRLTVRSGRSRFVLPTFPGVEFPTLPLEAGDGHARFELAGSTLADAIEQVQFAISTEETRYYLNGIYLHAVAGEGVSLRLVTTDGHRLARVDIGEVEGVTLDMPGAIVPRKTVAVLKKLAEAAGDNRLQLCVARNLIRAEYADVILVSKLIEGTFPDYERVIPYANPLKVTAQAPALASACDRVALLSYGEKSAERSITLALEPGRLVISGSNNDGGEAIDEIDVDYDGAPFEIRFSPKKLAEILRVSGADTVTIALADPGAPALFQASEISPALHLLMPMRR